MEKRKILYVDDDLNMLNMGEDILMDAGYAVSLCKSGEQAIKLLKKNSDFSLILLDVDMPGMDGYETYEAIRAIEDCVGIPIIFLTGMDAPDFEIKGLEMGAADYIAKPFIKSVLLARIKREITKAESVASLSGIHLSDKGMERAKEVLSYTELNVAKLVAEGYSNQEIADRTDYSYAYVKKIVSDILTKLTVKNRTELRALLRE